MKVLIVAGSSRLGPYASASLEKEHELRVTDIVPVETSHEFMEMDISSMDDVMRASEGMDAIVNCSVVRPDRQLAFDVNTRGCYNMMRAAVDHGIGRVINTGPHFTIAAGTYEYLDYDINPDVPPHPGTGLYALSKGLGQETCRVFTEHHDLHVLCLLFYNFQEHDNLSGRNSPFMVTWRDAGEAVRCAVEVDLNSLPSKCEVFNIFTDLPHRRFSNVKSRRLLGWEPQDILEENWRK